MKYSRFYFLYESKKPESVELADKLIDRFGQYHLDECEAIIAIGGDGSLTRGFTLANGKPVYGLTPASSDSQGFWTDHDVKSPEDFIEHLERAHVVPVEPVKATIEFENGRQETVYTLNEIEIERTSPQAAAYNLSYQFNNVSSAKYHIKSDGMIFASSYGSTGSNRSYNGSTMDISTPSLTIVTKGPCEPRGGPSPFVAMGQESSFRVDFVSAADKRPVKITCGNKSITADTDGSAIKAMTVRLASPEDGKTINFLTTKVPAIRAFEATFPQSPRIIP